MINAIVVICYGNVAMALFSDVDVHCPAVNSWDVDKAAVKNNTVESTMSSMNTIDLLHTHLLKMGRSEPRDAYSDVMARSRAVFGFLLFWLFLHGSVRGQGAFSGGCIISCL